MVRAWTLFFGLLLAASHHSALSVSVDFSDIREIIGLGKEIGTSVLESLKWVHRHDGSDGNERFPLVKGVEERLFNKINAINRKVESLQSDIEQSSSDVISVLLRELPEREQLDRDIRDLNDYFDRVDDIHDQYVVYNITQAKYQRYTLEDFARKCVSLDFRALPDLLKSLHRLVVPNFNHQNTSVFFQLAERSREASAQLCNSQQSPQQLLYNLYKIIQMTEVKGYMMMHFSYELLTLYTNESFAKERSKAYNDHANRVVETLRTVRTAMTYAPKALWKCDPARHEEGKTYTELKQLFQGYIVNEVDLNPTATCRQNCGYYSLSKVHSCYDNMYCSQQRRCKGKVLNCRYIDSDMWICPSSEENRRYHSIKYENGVVFGDQKTCRRPTTKVDSWWRWLFWHCSYCMCTCDDHNASSDRYFSLRNVTSDVMNNKVITGMRWKKVNQIVHLQIKEGKLLEHGQIDPDSNSWQPIDNFTMLNRDIRVGRDYHALSWEQKAIDLDDLTLTDERVVTGIRFRMVGSHLNFEIRATPFNYTTGKLIKPMEKSIWIGNDNTDNDSNSDKRRTEFVINEPDIPTKSKAQSMPDSETNQFLNFAPTDLKKDVAQTTIPFLDIQPVETNPPSPLSGAGVFHKGRNGYGGFLALKIITFDFTEHIITDYKPTPLLDTTEGTTVNEIPAVK